MTNASFVQNMPHASDDIVRSDASGLIDNENAVHGGIVDVLVLRKNVESICDTQQPRKNR